MSSIKRGAGKLIAIGAFTVIALGGIAAGGVTATEHAARPHELTVQQIDAHVAKSMVQLQVDYSAYVAYQAMDNSWIWSKKPVTASFACSGWFADSTGDIVTAGHCVDRHGSRADVVDAYIQQLEQDPVTGIDQTWIKDNQEWAERTWKVRASDNTGTPDQHVTVFQSAHLQGATLTKPVSANVLGVRPFDREDVAVVHVDVKNTPGLPIAPGNPSVGSDVTLVGFPGSVSDVVNPKTLEASFKSGTISSQQSNDNGVTKLEVNADISAGMSGGPAIDSRGRVVGLNSFYIDGESENFNFITDTDSMSAFLKRLDIRTPATFDRWVDHAAVAGEIKTYSITGGGVLIAGIVAALVLVLVSRRRRLAPATTNVIPGFGRDGVPVDTAPVTIPDSFLATCEFGHDNPADAAFCSTCGSTIGPRSTTLHA